MFMLSVNLEESNRLREQYELVLDNMCIEELVEEFISYLEYREESESGRSFHPITISSCRVLMTEPLAMVIARLKGFTSSVCPPDR
jgi:hypothetical protein